MKRSIFAALGVAAFLMQMVAFVAVGSTQSETDATAHSLFLELMSPFCPGRSLQDCPSSKATELKTEIRAKLASGQTEHQIMTEMVGRFGDEVRAVPPHAGVGLLAWALPIVFFLVGGSIFAIWVIRGTRAAEPKP